MARILFCACIALAVPFRVIGAEKEAQNDQPSLASSSEAEAAVALVIRMWNQGFAARIKVGDAVATLETYMAGKFREKTRYVFGGTGNFDMLYLIDDVLQVRVACSPQETVADAPIVEKKWTWLRRPDGVWWVVPPPNNGGNRNEAANPQQAAKVLPGADDKKP